MRIPVILLLLTVCAAAFAQRREINGSLRTADGQPVPHASVTLTNAQGRIAAFKTSDAGGLFVLDLPDTAALTAFRIEVKHLGYKPVALPLAEGRTQYPITMEEQAIDLSEVIVKNRPRIASRGDTLAYDMGSFAKAEDRSVGDVIRRMPGIEVNDDGRIKYNGQDISNFYIDGDDLLADKYAIGTNTIPHGMVQSLEVMQNHQPLKVLQDKSLSNQVALNLVIKDEAKLSMTGQAKIGAGLPGQYDGELNALLFNKKYKMFNVLKGNNVGTDLASDFTSFNLESTLSGLGNSRPAALLSGGTAGDPALPKRRYYFNNSGSLNANNLVNLNSGWQLKSNINLLLDHSDMTYNSRSEVYLGADTIRYDEYQQIDRDPFLTELVLSARANEESYYFNNVLNLHYAGGADRSGLQSNTMDFGQQLRHRIRDFSNTLEYVPELKNKHVISVNWYLNHFNRPERLSIAPGINADILNGGRPLDAIRQEAETPAWFNRLSVSYRIPSGRIRQAYRAGVLNEFQHLLSDLYLTQPGGDVTEYAGSAGNDLRWSRQQVFADATYELVKGRWENSLTLPLTAQRIGYRDAGTGLDERSNRLLFNPSLYAKYAVTTSDYLVADYSFSNNMGNIGGVYRGAILTNYRSLVANDAVLQERYGHRAGLRYQFQRAIAMLFINAGVNYSKTTANTIASSIMTDDIVRTILLPIENDVSSFSANAGISKYIFALGATAKLSGSWNTARFDQIQNGERLPFNNISVVVDAGIEARLFDLVSLDYRGVGTWVTSKLLATQAAITIPDRQIRQYDQQASLTATPAKGLFIRVSGRHQFTSQEAMQDISYLFVDANIRYRINAWRTDVELDLSNLTNVRAYETYFLSANSFGYSHYNLRGTMAVLKATFNL